MPGKTVLITGATRGIGLTFVEHYVAAGWNVIAAARNVDKADKLRELLPYKLVQLDVVDEESIARAAKELDGESIDLLINNAGVLWRETLDNAKKEDLMTQFEVNAVGPFLMTQAFHSNLKRAVCIHGDAVVVNLTSRRGSIGLIKSGGQYGYRASKAALNMINKSLAVDLKKDAITSIVVNPGFVSTAMNGYTGIIQPKESVAAVAKIIETAAIQDSGKYFDFTGDELPW